MSKLIKLAVAAAMLAGMLALAPTAQAHPSTAIDCVVDGSVRTYFQTYSFASSTFVCTGSYNGAAMVGSYDVYASGNTKGLIDPTGPETCDEGQSAGSGVISAGLDPSQPNSGAPESFAGTVDFTRVGLNVVATGTLADGVTGHLVDFAADLVFTPTNLNPVDCVGGTPASLDALLTGDAVLTDGTQVSPAEVVADLQAEVDALEQVVLDTVDGVVAGVVEDVNAVSDTVDGVVAGVVEDVDAVVDTVSELSPVVIAPDIGYPSRDCKRLGGQQVVDTTTQGVEVYLYTYQVSTEQVHVCWRADSGGTGVGGKLVISTEVPSPGSVGAPSVDGNASACTTTTSPPNRVPGSHPVASGGVAGVPYSFDAYSDGGSTAWACVQVGSAVTRRVVVPVSVTGPSGDAVVAWYPDEGTA